MWEIYNVLPATFTVIQKRTKHSSRTVSRRLNDLKACGFIQKEVNLYVGVPVEKWDYFKEVLENPRISKFTKFELVVMDKLEVFFIRKQRGKDSEIIKTSGRKEWKEYQEKIKREWEKG